MRTATKLGRSPMPAGRRRPKPASPAIRWPATYPDGLPAAKLSDTPGENDRRMMNVMLDRMEDYRTPAWHMIGTCRMGADPETSVVNKWNQSWDVPNLFIVDGSVLATGGVVNPTPTIPALALRAAGYVRDHFRDLQGATRSLAA